MSVGILHVLFVAAAVLTGGGFVAGYRRGPASALAGIAVMLGGAAIAMAGVSRFAASGLDPLSGQAFAILIALAALAVVGLGAGWLQSPEEPH